MEKDTTRLANFDKSMKDNKIVYERFNAIDGSKVTRDERLSEYCNTFCTNGMKGCALSHRSIWDIMIKNGYKNVLIFEDDALIEKDFDRRFNDVWNFLPKDYDIMYFGCLFGCTDDSFGNNVYKKLTGFETEKVNEYVYTTKGTAGLHGYMLSLEGAKKFATKSIGFHVDLQIFSWIKQYGYTAYTVNINMVETSQNNSNLSDTYPVLVNSLLSKININNNKNPTTLDWGINENFLKVGPFNINAFILLLMLVILLLSPKYYYIILIWLSLELFVSGDFKNTFRYIFLLGIPMALKIYFF